MVLQRFAEDPLIVSNLVYLDDAPKGEDGRPKEEGASGSGELCGECCMQTMRGWCRHRFVGLPG